MIGTVMVPMLLTPRPLFRRFVVTWSAGNGVLLRIIAGVHSEIRNRQYRPTGPAIIASKHQSEWEAHVFLHELDDPAYVIKKELSYVPGYGWFSAKVNMIFVDREGGGKSLRALVRGAQKAVARGRRSYYTAAVKALGSEKFFALCDELDAANVGMVTGDAMGRA